MRHVPALRPNESGTCGSRMGHWNAVSGEIEATDLDAESGTIVANVGHYESRLLGLEVVRQMSVPSVEKRAARLRTMTGRESLFFCGKSSFLNCNWRAIFEKFRGTYLGGC